MPSKTSEGFTDQTLQIQMDELAALSKQIDDCVAEEQWEQLITVLNLRQQCLEVLFAEPIVEPEILKSLAHSIIEQDKLFVEKIQEQKKIIEKQLHELSKGQQAVQAYGA